MDRWQPLRLRVGAGHNDREMEFSLPAEWDVRVYRHRGGPELSAAAIRRAFARPVGTKPIREAARGARSAVILVDDFRRPTPVELLCLIVIDELNHAGIGKDGISVLIGNGAHRIMTKREARRRLGTAYDRVGQVVSHDAFSRDVAFVGVTTRGTPVLVNRVAAEADFSISISTVYPHAFTAWGGGAKLVLPGISHVSSMHYHHMRQARGEWGGPPGKCPARADLEEAAAMFGLDVSLCCAINDRKQLCGLCVGDPTKSHRSAVGLARRVYETDMAGCAPDLVIANAYPMDGDPTQIGKTEVPARKCGAPILIIVDFADPCPWHGVYHGPRRQFLRRPQPTMPERTPERLANAEVFVFCPQTGNGYTPANPGWYADSDWNRLIAAVRRRFPAARVAVLPSAPLQMPNMNGSTCRRGSLG